MTLHYSDDSITLYHGDSLAVAREIASGSVDCIVTSPPYYGLRDYGIAGQYGQEESPAAYVETMRALFSELRRVLSADGTLWLNIGDSYSAAPSGPMGASSQMRAGNGRLNDCVTVAEQSKARKSSDLPPKNLLGIPWRVAFALQDDGWILRNAIVWHKPNTMPESVTDRLSSRYELMFIFSESQRYWFDLDSLREPHASESIARAQRRRLAPDRSQEGVGTPNTLNPMQAVHAGGRNPGDVWSIPTTPFAAAHFAVMARELAERAIQGGCPPRRCKTCGRSPTRTTGERVLDLSRPQAQRAQELADAAGLTPAHLAAIRSAGVTDTGKAATNQTGTGNNTEDVQRLADEAKAALGGYYREFLLARPESTGWTDCGHNDYRPGIVLDPFSGSGTTGLAAAKHGRSYVGIDLNAEYLDLSLRTRLLQPGLFEQGA